MNKIHHFSCEYTMVYVSHFLVELFTGMPNHLKHYNHIGFQSYFMHPQMLETIDKKIIVFVDDLDRLNQTEILQV